MRIFLEGEFAREVEVAACDEGGPERIFVLGAAYRRTGRTFAGLRVYAYRFNLKAAP